MCEELDGYEFVRESAVTNGPNHLIRLGYKRQHESKDVHKGVMRDREFEYLCASTKFAVFVSAWPRFVCSLSDKVSRGRRC